MYKQADRQVSRYTYRKTKYLQTDKKRQSNIKKGNKVRNVYETCGYLPKATLILMSLNGSESNTVITQPGHEPVHPPHPVVDDGDRHLHGVQLPGRRAAPVPALRLGPDPCPRAEVSESKGKGILCKRNEGKFEK